MCFGSMMEKAKHGTELQIHLQLLYQPLLSWHLIHRKKNFYRKWPCCLKVHCSCLYVWNGQPSLSHKEPILPKSFSRNPNYSEEYGYVQSIKTEVPRLGHFKKDIRRLSHQNIMAVFENAFYLPTLLNLLRVCIRYHIYGD